jgi:hypothetical protein
MRKDCMNSFMFLSTNLGSNGSMEVDWMACTNNLISHDTRVGGTLRKGVEICMARLSESNSNPMMEVSHRKIPPGYGLAATHRAIRTDKRRKEARRYRPGDAVDIHYLKSHPIKTESLKNARMFETDVHMDEDYQVWIGHKIFQRKNVFWTDGLRNQRTRTNVPNMRGCIRGKESNGRN